MNDHPNPAAGSYPLASASLGLMLAGTFLPSPLYELYRRDWGLSPAEISIVFAVYAASLIPALLFLGGISDRIGRRRTLLVALALQAVAALIFAFAANIWWLIAARMVQGCALGIGSGAATAATREWMPERMLPRAGMVTVIGSGLGSAAGALLGGSVAQYAPFPLTLPYLVYIAFLAVIAAGVARVPSCPHRVSAGKRAFPTIPAAIRRPFFIASVESFVSWATFAIFVSLLPSFLARSLDIHNLMLGALVVACLQTGMVTASFAGRRLANRRAIVTSMLALGGGVWLLLLAVPLHAYALLALATIVVGAGGGLSYLAGLNIVGAIAPPERRAEVTSAFFVACYLGFSLPALGVGIAANRFGLYDSIVGAAVLLGVVAVTMLVLTTERNLRPAAVPG